MRIKRNYQILTILLIFLLSYTIVLGFTANEDEGTDAGQQSSNEKAFPTIPVETSPGYTPATEDTPATLRIEQSTDVTKLEGTFDGVLQGDGWSAEGTFSTELFF